MANTSSLVVKLFDITNSINDITNKVNAKDQTKVKLFISDNVSHTMTFTDLQVDNGDPCSIALSALKI